jgi:hypothetical protein
MAKVQSKLAMLARQALLFSLVTACLAACASAPGAVLHQVSTPISQAHSIPSSSTVAQPSQPFDITGYAFPATIDPAGHYLFYLHGKIIEDQGLPAVSPEYGTYDYPAILEKLGSYGLVVISELRAKNTDGQAYAKRIAGQVTQLLNSGVPAGNITVAGASKGGAIAILASSLLANDALNYVLLAACDPASQQELKKNDIHLYGNILSIYDSADQVAGSCQELFAFSTGKGLSKHAEIVLQVGSGHGMLYKPLDGWIMPLLRWAGSPQRPDCECNEIPSATPD